MTIGSLDLTILIAYVIATIAFGLWISRGQKSASDYLLGGRNLPWWALLISIVATETSTATFLSVPGIAYHRGDLRFLQLPLGYIVGRVIASGVLLPLYFKGELFTAYDVLRVRSGPAVRTIASALFLITRTLADGLRLYLAAVVLQIMLGCALWQAVAFVGGATVLYTVLGGIKAVVWTDVIQFAVYMLGAIAALVVLHGDLDGGIGSALQGVDTAAFFDFGWDFGSAYTFWAGLIGGAVLSIGSHGVDQLIVQRYLSARNLREAQRALLWSGPVVLAQFAIFLVLGLGLAAFYAHREFASNDAVFADFIVKHLPTPLVGIVLGSVFSAAMSTLSSSLSASASALVNDFVLPITGHRKDEPFALRAARAATVLFAVAQVAVGVSGLGGRGAVVNQVLGIATITTGVILGLFVLALLRRRSRAASLVGLCAGIVAIVVVSFGLPAGAIAWPWHGVLSAGTTVLVGGIATVFFAPQPS
ncbi:MAG: sodium:solute symporter [Planctomycetes bacterium]|nr:sodium:solute symporter [Planctomycetota bacterium]